MMRYMHGVMWVSLEETFSPCFTLFQVSSRRERQKSEWSLDCLNGPSGFQEHVYRPGSHQLSWLLLTWVWTQHTGTQQHQCYEVYSLLNAMLQFIKIFFAYCLIPRPHIPISKLMVSESYDTYISRSFQVTREILTECKNLGKVENAFFYGLINPGLRSGVWLSSLQPLTFSLWWSPMLSLWHILGNCLAKLLP